MGMLILSEISDVNFLALQVILFENSICEMFKGQVVRDREVIRGVAFIPDGGVTLTTQAFE
jgi:hypothetical protein